MGAPGSGKTTWAINTYGKESVKAADDWFKLFNKDTFDPKKLGAAHKWCYEQVLERLRAGETVVVNNTNTTLKEMFKYVAARVFGGYPHEIVFAIMPETDVNVLVQQNVHNVPYEAIQSMVARLATTGIPTVEKVLQTGEMAWGKNLHRKVDYVAIWLTEQSKQDLLYSAAPHLGLPMGVLGLRVLQDDHDVSRVSRIRPDPDQVAELWNYLGKEIELKVRTLATHDYMQAIGVDIMDKKVAELYVSKGGPFLGKPRIILSTSDVLRDVGDLVKSQLSSRLLELKAKEVDDSFPVLKGRIGFYLHSDDPERREIIFGDDKKQLEQQHLGEGADTTTTQQGA